MLTIFRRHRTGCPHKSRRYRRCQCAIWIEGSIGEERVQRRSLNLTSWEAAEDYVRESNRTGKLGGTTFRHVPISEAVELYLSDVRARVRASTSETPIAKQSRCFPPNRLGKHLPIILPI